MLFDTMDPTMMLL